MLVARSVNSLGFNTQPPEGGWGWRISDMREITGFNTQPPEGGWDHVILLG